MDRRDFLRLGVAGATVGACDRSPPIAMPGLASPADMDAFFARLDNGMVRIEQGNPMRHVLDHLKLGDTSLTAAELQRDEALVRKSLRSLLLVGSYGDLSPEGKAHPEMIGRIARGADEMDDAVRGVQAHFDALGPERRAAIQTRLRAQPELGDAVGHALDARAAQIGISIERRMHLQSIVQQTSWRLRAQPMTTFVDEQSATIRNIAERQYRRVLEDLEAADTSKQPVVKERSGTKVVRVGAILLGVGAVLGLVGGAVTGGGNIAGAFILTAGGTFLIAGLIVIIVGAAMNSSSD
ncbi:MAG: hypothetical protein KF819_24450 [Labilithrix sp.]|nr:hypothetical protein [Labilithrix sp.]